MPSVRGPDGLARILVATTSFGAVLRWSALAIRAAAGAVVGGAVDMLIIAIRLGDGVDVPTVAELVGVPILCAVAHVFLGIFVGAYSLPEERS